ncbi:MAG: biopolymer transporter ExbD [Deltaproteobacteria bacterium]|nr:biopolymer transporter ExbD [Deltaproteobacteria bacterium]
MLNITAARRTGRQALQLDIAPLIDMIFILLIFFLVTTSFVKETGVEVNRPVAATAASGPATGVLVAVTSSGEIFMENEAVPLEVVQARVERALAENPKAGVMVVADENSRTGLAVRVMDACRRAGAEDVALAASLPE